MKQIKNKFGILGESHGQDRKHKEEITIFKNPAENQQRNKENNILEVLGQALRKQKNLQKTKKKYFRTLSGDTPNSRTWKKPKKTKEPKKTIFQNSFWRHPKFQDLEKTKKTKRTKKNNISELFLETPQIPRPLEFFFFLVFCRFLSRGLKYCFFGFLQGFGLSS